MQQGEQQPAMRICLGETDLVREADFSEDVMTELRAQKLYRLTRQVAGGWGWGKDTLGLGKICTKVLW